MAVADFHSAAATAPGAGEGLLRRAWRRFLLARMITALERMPNAALARIGAAREDITVYARKLIDLR